jgi:hypothetical protein
MILLKMIFGLMMNQAPLKQYYLNIGSHLLKKGAGFEVGQIVKEKRLSPGLYRVKVITGLFYDFKTNKVTHTADNRIMKIDEKKR